jgi:hypothetical protein
MNAEDLTGLGAKFDTVDQSIGMDQLRAYERFADELEGRWKASPAKP